MDTHSEPIPSESLQTKNLASGPYPKLKKAHRLESKKSENDDAANTPGTIATIGSTKPKPKLQAHKRKRKHEETRSVENGNSTIHPKIDSEQVANSQHESGSSQSANEEQDNQEMHLIGDRQIEQTIRNSQDRQNERSIKKIRDDLDEPEEQDKHNLSSKRGRKKRKKQHDSEPQWKVSEPIGGLFADQLPIFSADEEHLLLAQAHSIKVYATATSALVRTCTPDGHGISSFCLSAQDPNRIYILLDNGRVQLWNWTTAEKLMSWGFEAKISNIAVSTINNGDDASDVVFTIETRKKKSSITAHQLNGRERIGLGVLYEHKDSIRAIKVLGFSQYIIAITSNSVIVGTRVQDETKKGKQLQYIFRTFKAPENIACFAARVNSATTSKKTGSSGIDVVVGLEDGSLRIYSDAGLEHDKHKDNHTTPANVKAHWHRSAVGSVAWASDGNYVISGGRETVLVLWQLDTNTQTKIPHLTSAIESIAVSTRGASYAIRLADNSVMIVGTQDFIPTFHVAGVAFPSTQHHSNKSLAQRLPHRRMPVTSISAQPPRLMSAVPSDMLTSGREVEQSPAGFYSNTSLQSTVLSSIGAAVSKQALVNNNSTTIRKRPDGHELVPPNVVLIAADFSGTCLATIDEWYQPINDILPNSAESGEVLETQVASVMVNLVFWSWNKEKNSWDSSTRVPGPHTDHDQSLQPSSLVLDLIAAPGSAAFWTLGANGRIKYWTTKKKQALGSRAVSGGKKEAASIWKCTRSITVPYASKDVHDVASGRIATTKDGSVFAVSKMTSQGSEVTVFTLHSDGTTRQVFTFKSHHQGISIAFLNQWFVFADHESVLVRNLTDTTKWYTADLGSDAIASNAAIAPHLVVDDARQVIALSLAQKKGNPGHVGNSESKILIFSVSSDIPVATFDHQPASAALICVPSTGKFWALTTGAEIYSISHSLGETLNGMLDEALGKDTNEKFSENKTPNTLSKIFGTLDANSIHAAEEDTPTETESLRKKIAWNDIPGLNLDQPFALPKTSAIQRLSALAIGA